MLIRLLMVCVLVLAPGLAQAEQVEAPKDEKGKFSGSFEFGLDQATGNSPSDNFDSAVELGYEIDIWSADFTFKGNRTKEAGVLTAEYYESYLKGKVELPKHFYYFVQFGYRQDEFSGIYSERTSLTGFGYHFFEDEPKYSLDTELGYGLRDTKKTTKITIDHDPGVHGAIMGKYQFSDRDTLEANVTVESGNDDDFIKEEVKWEHVIADALKIVFAYDSRTLTKPEIGKEATDTNLSVKLGLEF